VKIMQHTRTIAPALLASTIVAANAYQSDGAVRVNAVSGSTTLTFTRFPQSRPNAMSAPEVV
jgi:hypothetical protein